MAAMDVRALDDLVMWLRQKRWTDAELTERVYPLRPR